MDTVIKYYNTCPVQIVSDMILLSYLILLREILLVLNSLASL